MIYENANGISYRKDQDGDTMLANFTAQIVEETSYYGGVTPEKTLTLIGERMNPDGTKPPIKLPPITISDTEFVAMQWPLKYWGVACVIIPGGGSKEDLRTSIQLLSTPANRSIYRQVGWRVLEDERLAYLHRGGAITAKGNDPTVTVQLPPELRYDLSSADPKKFGESVKATLKLIDLGPPSLTWPTLAATLAPLYGPVDFALHVTGRTGSFKSEYMSLWQSHYGPEMDARHLPCSWSSSENALEAMAFLAANAAMVIDDFVPHGSQWQQRAYQGKAERIFRAQGNQAGRQRLTDVSSVQQTMYPRGCVLSTGEDTPEGHSVRGRMLIREIQPGDIDTAKLSAAQAARPLYCGTVAWLCQQFAKEGLPDVKGQAQVIRDALIDIGHSRTPSTLGHMVAVLSDFLTRCVNAKFLSAKERSKYQDEMEAAIVEAGREQAAMLEATDPVEIFFGTLKQIWASGGGHIRSVSGGVPRHAEQLGWTCEAEMGDGIKSYKARGQCIGWCSAKRDELYIEPTAGITLAKKVAGSEIPLSKNTLMKRIGESGKLVRKDETRQKNTCRVACEEATRHVMVFRLSEVLDLNGEVTEEE